MRTLKKLIWPHKVSVPVLENADIEYWLGENMGIFKGKWNVVYNHKTIDYYFRNEKDAILFALRWK